MMVLGGKHPSARVGLSETVREERGGHPMFTSCGRVCVEGGQAYDTAQTPTSSGLRRPAVKRHFQYLI